MTQITKLFEKCLNLHKNYKYVEEKENLKKFAEFSLDKVLSFIQAYKKTENYSDKKAEVFHSLSSNLMESQQDNSVKALEKAIELDPNRAFYYEEYFNIF